jgi:hypothetical protein
MYFYLLTSMKIVYGKYATPYLFNLSKMYPSIVLVFSPFIYRMHPM